MNSGSTEELEALVIRARALGLPSSFILGAATASYQIEGAVAEDGKGESIWDRFSHRIGVIEDGSTGDVACDHYHRWPKDLDLMRRLGLDAYRFSISWSRIMRSGRGPANPAGLDFYDRLVEALLAIGITPFVTLYHWDLPQALQDEGGGWLRRGIVDDYLAYVDAVTKRLGDRVRHWATFNEPWTFTWWGYAFGVDAPGLALGAGGALAAGHHVLLGHGRAVPLIRANVPDAQIGIVLDLNHVSPASDDPQDIAAARRFEGCQNRWYLDVLFKGSYPVDMIRLYGDQGPRVEKDDLAIIATAFDYLGINVYRRSVIADGTDMPPVNVARVSPPGRYTGIGWEVHPPCLRDIVGEVHRIYAPAALYITENGAAYPDRIDADGAIHDLERSRYLVEHLEQVRHVVEDGVPLKGYFAWTLMDNFEWAHGFSQRFGLVHVDLRSQRRRIKSSGELFATIAANRTPGY